jgi:hypothetical protein
MFIRYKGAVSKDSLMISRLIGSLSPLRVHYFDVSTIGRSREPLGGLPARAARCGCRIQNAAFVLSPALNGVQNPTEKREIPQDEQTAGDANCKQHCGHTKVIPPRLHPEARL